MHTHNIIIIVCVCIHTCTVQMVVRYVTLCNSSTILRYTSLLNYLTQFGQNDVVAV